MKGSGFAGILDVSLSGQYLVFCQISQSNPLGYKILDPSISILYRLYNPLELRLL
jgi:hypothetical protein